MKEKWKWVVGYEGYYRVSSFGRVRSVDRMVHGKRSAQRLRGRVLRQSLAGVGYRFVSFSIAGKITAYYVHHLVLTAFVGPCPVGMQACHFPDKDLGNNRLDNLRWDTCIENAADRRKHGTVLDGEKNPAAKLTSKDIVAIRRMRERGSSLNRIAKAFGISFQHVSRIVHGERWQHLQGV